ncbi:MAG: carbonic anhydrase family protein [Cyanobacteria bacterium P01_F01_bin.13]
MAGLSLLTRRIFLKLFLAGVASRNDLWGYDGAADPAHWAELSADYHTCGDGRRQSPIDIDITAAMADLVSFDYRPIPINLFNNGRTIQETGSEACTLTIDNSVYTLVQFHFHTPSEHTHGGIHYPMELHLVHRHPSGALAVVAVWITSGAQQPELVTISKNLPQQTGGRIHNASMVNPDNLLPKLRDLVRYSGSLTTPPCSEGVTWLVMSNPIEASARQIETFHQLLGNNARPLQRLEG